MSLFPSPSAPPHRRTVLAGAALAVTVTLSVSCSATAVNHRAIGEDTPAAGVESASTGDRPVAVVYRGPASECEGDGCSEAVFNLIKKSPLNFKVSYIGPNEAKKLTAANLKGVDLYAQPGGDDDAEGAMRTLRKNGQDKAIKDFVKAGGHYVGFCMGAYLAGSDPGMNLLGYGGTPGNTDEYSSTNGALVDGDEEAVIPLEWGSERRYMYVQAAPYIIPSKVAGERILSRFTNGKINALVRPVGRGSVGVVGSHPEADRSWYSNKLWKKDLDGLDDAQGLELIAVTMGN